MRSERAPFWDVLEEHLVEAEFLWTQWERCLVSPSYTLHEMAEREEERLLANLDGLVSGGAHARDRVVLPALEADEPGLRVAAALALLGAGDAAVAEPLVALLREGNAPLRATAERALGLADAAWIDDAMRSLLAHSNPLAQAAALRVLAFRRASAGGATLGLRLDDDPALLAAALRTAATAATSPDQSPAPFVVAALGATEPAVRDEAITAGLVRGAPEAWAACRALVREPPASLLGEEPAWLLLAATLGDVSEVEPLVHAHGAPALQRAAVWALGYSGRVAAVETLLRLLDDPALGKLAGEGIVAITGLAPRDPFVVPESAREADEPRPLLEDDPHASLLPRPEDDLPSLDPAAVERWWGEQKSRFDRGRRYLYGVPWGRDSVLAVLSRGPMRRRHALALELAARTRGKVHLETRAFSARQRAELGRAEEVPFS